MSGPAHGRFISFEGGEGAGKSTQIKRLAASLRQRGLDVLETREPGGTPGAEAIRTLVLEGATDRWDAMTEALLFYAARRDHVERVIRPALARGTWVLSDRFGDSSIVYQGAVLGAGEARVRALHELALGPFWPDLTLILDLDPALGLARAHARDGEGAYRYERMAGDIHEAMRAAFLALAAREPARCLVIDAQGASEDVAAAVLAAVRKRLLKAM
ncbi:MAG: dTMP kinase [Pseudomonadota bacterium]